MYTEIPIVTILSCGQWFQSAVRSQGNFIGQSTAWQCDKILAQPVILNQGYCQVVESSSLSSSEWNVAFWGGKRDIWEMEEDKYELVNSVDRKGISPKITNVSYMHAKYK